MSKNSESQRLHASLHLASYSAYKVSFSHEFHHELLNDGTVKLIGPKLRMLLSGDGDVDEVGVDGMAWRIPYPSYVSSQLIDSSHTVTFSHDSWLLTGSDHNKA